MLGKQNPQSNLFLPENRLRQKIGKEGSRCFRSMSVAEAAKDALQKQIDARKATEIKTESEILPLRPNLLRNRCPGLG